MKKQLTLVIALMAYHFMFAQQASPSIGNTGNVAIPNNFQTVMFVKQKSPPKENRKGSPYLFQSPTEGVIYTRNYGSLKGYKINYNIENKEFDIYSDSGIKVLPEIHVDSFEVKILDVKKYKTAKITYLNLLHLSKNDESSPLLGFGKLIGHTNGIMMVDKVGVKIIKPNYNPATDTGEKAEKIEVKATTYIVKNNFFYNFPLRKKELDNVFGSKATTIKEYAKREKLNLNRKEDFIESLASLN